MVIRAKLSLRNPIRLDTMLMQDLHMAEHHQLVARLQAQGHDAAIGEWENEVVVFDPKDIHVQEIMQDSLAADWYERTSRSTAPSRRAT